jgi:ubiquinone biosynthesis protein COQ9
MKCRWAWHKFSTYTDKQGDPNSVKGDRRFSRLQRGSVAGPSRQHEIVIAGRWGNGAISRFLGSLLRHHRKAGFCEICIIQGLITATFSHAEELIGVGALRNGASTLANLGFVDTIQAALAKML